MEYINATIIIASIITMVIFNIGNWQDFMDDEDKDSLLLFILFLFLSIAVTAGVIKLTL